MYVCLFCHISTPRWHRLGTWETIRSWKTRTYLSYTIDIMAADDLVVCVVGLVISRQSVTVTPWRLKSPASRLSAQTFVQTQIKKSIKAPRHWPLGGEFTGNRWIPLTTVQLRGKKFPFDDVIMSGNIPASMQKELIPTVHMNINTDIK